MAMEVSLDTHNFPYTVSVLQSVKRYHGYGIDRNNANLIMKNVGFMGFREDLTLK